MWITWLVSTALATPTLTGDSTELTQMLTELWPLAEACAGRPAGAPTSLGTARTVEMHETFPQAAEPVVHARGAGRQGDVARAAAHWWFVGEPALLAEGRRQVLARCAMSKVEEGWLSTSMEADLSAMPDLLSPASAGVPAAHHGARVLFDALARSMGHEALVAKGLGSWDALLAALEAGQGGKVAQALRGGAEAQRAMLADEDGDGLVAAAEWMAGTDPTKWDSDGDGWWDGAPADRPEGATPHPFANRIICPAEHPKKDDSGEVTLVTYFLDGQVSTKHIPVKHSATTFLIPTPPGSAGSGIWMSLEPAAGDALEPNDTCAPLDTGVVLRLDEDLGTLHTDLAAALGPALAEAATFFGVDMGRVYVEVGAERTQVVRRSAYGENAVGIELDPEECKWAQRAGRIDLLARTVAVMQVAGVTSQRFRTDAALASMLASFTPDLPKRTWFGALKGDIKDWDKRVDRCSEGWAGLISGACR